MLHQLLEVHLNFFVCLFLFFVYFNKLNSIHQVVLEKPKRNSSNFIVFQLKEKYFVVHNVKCFFQNLKICHRHNKYHLMHFVFFCYAYQCVINRMMISKTKLIIIETFVLIQKFVKSII